MSVHTGFATNAGTRSTVRFDMVGDKGSTGQRLMSDTDGFLVRINATAHASYYIWFGQNRITN